MQVGSTPYFLDYHAILSIRYRDGLQYIRPADQSCGWKKASRLSHFCFSQSSSYLFNLIILLSKHWCLINFQYKSYQKANNIGINIWPQKQSHQTANQIIEVIKFYLIIKLMYSNQQNNVTGNQTHYSFSNPSANIGLPINSRLINQSTTLNQPYFNNYHTVNQSQAQHLYSPVSVPRQSIVYQNNLSPFPMQTISNSQIINNSQINRNVQGVQGVRTRLAPVTQYVPVYDLEDGNQTVNQSQSIHQRIILHQPEAFQERILYDEKLEVMPTVIEEQKVNAVYAAAPSTESVKIVKVQRDPLVETVQGQWKSRVSNSKASYVAPTPIPRESKLCCSGWLIFLLALLALGGILTAILIGKAFSQQSVNNSPQSTVEGTKVQATRPNVDAVQPLTDAKISVKGTTAVTTPIFAKAAAQIDNSPVKQQVESITPTDISVVAHPKVSSIPQSVQPQQMDVAPVKSRVIAPNSFLSNGIPTNTDQLSVYETVKPNALTIEPINVQPIIKPLPLQPTTIQPLTLQPTAIKPLAIEPTTIKPATTYPTIIQPEAIAPQSVLPTVVTTPTTYVSSLQKNQPLQGDTNNSAVFPYQIPAVIVSPRRS